MSNLPVWTRKNLVFSLIALFICLLGIYQLIHKADLPFDTDYDHSGNLIVLPNSYTGGLPLAENDILKNVEGNPVNSVEEVEFILDIFDVESEIEIEIIRGDLELKMHVTTVPYNSLFYLLVISIVGGLFFLVAVFVLVKRPHSEISAVLYYAFLCVSIQICATFANLTLPNNFLGIFNRSAYIIFTGFIPVIFVHFSFVFPGIKWTRYRTLVIALYTFTFFLVGSLVFLFNLSVNPINRETFTRFLYLYNVSRFFYAVLISFAVVNILHSYFSSKSEPERRKVRWVVLGLVIGPLNFVLTWQFPLSLGYVNLIPEEYMLLIMAVVPIMFAISIVKYHIFDIDIIFKRSTVYISLFFLIAVSYAIGIALTTLFVGEMTVQSSYLAVIMAAVAVVFFLEPAKRSIQNFVDRKFFKTAYNYRIAQLNIASAINKCNSREELGKIVFDYLQGLLHPVSMGMYEHILSRENWETIFENNIELKNKNEILDALSDKVKSEKNTLFASRDKIEPGIDYTSLNSDQILTNCCSLACVVFNPEMSVGGILLIGRKKSEDIYTKEDIDLLKSISTHIGIALDRYRVIDDLIAKNIEFKHLEKLDRMKSLFVSGVSHDLKTPISSIRMFAEIMENEKNISDKDRSEYLEIIQGESDRLTRMISNVLDFALIERKESNYNLGPVNVVELVDKTLKVMKYPLYQQEFKVEKSIDLEDEIVIGDADAIQQMLINLITNAIKFSQKEKYLGIFLSEEGRDCLIQIVDKGIGIKKSDQKKIFNNYFRSKDSIEKGVGGVGLGLAIVNDIVKGHNGKIEIESEIDSGCKITVYLPKGNAS